MLRLALAVLLLVPLAAAQEPGIYNPDESTPTTMYFHINGFQDFPINTQKPSDKYASADGFGVVSHSACIPDEGQGSLLSRSLHTWYGYSSPGYVHYDVDQDGQPRYHPERGISFDVQLDPDVKPKLTWYLEGKAVNGEDQEANRVPVPIPNVVTRATVREGDAISVGHAALNQGEIIAQGQSSPANLAGPASHGAGIDDDTVTYIDLDGRHLYRFEFELDLQRTLIDKDESYNIRVDTFMDGNPAPGCQGPGTQDSGDYVMLGYVGVHTSSQYRPQMDWNVMNALRIEYLHPQFIGDDLVIHTSTNSPWGNYDVRGDQESEAAGGLEVEVEGPSLVATFDRVAIKSRTFEHDHHTEAVDATWVWEYKKDGAKEGLYTVTFKAKNDQETAEAFAVAQFEIGSGRVLGCGGQEKGGGQDACKEDFQKDDRKQGQQSPGIGLVVVLALVAAASVVRRR